MDILHAMRIFSEVASAGSFTRAADTLSSSMASVSRAITSLEDRLHTRLLQRSTRRVSLTEAGERYLIRCREVLRLIEDAEAEAAHAHIVPFGTMRLHATPGLGQHYLSRMIPGYVANYPEVSFDMSISPRVPDIIEESLDISFVASFGLEDSQFLSRRLGSTKMVLCASLSYLQTHGTPSCLDELSNHKCLELAGTTSHRRVWTLDNGGKEVNVDLKHIPLRVDSVDAMAVAIREGMGVGPLHAGVAISHLGEGAIRLVLPDYRLKGLDIFAIYSSRRFLDAKVRTFIDFLRDRIPAALDEEDQAVFRFASDQPLHLTGPTR
ncbi:LysR family transcriptional regulator [Paraburkholderia lycopersici]|uniref:DNA-binding transcriptional regulator, LysR family n=1 Tax=Paraburkholderia lycopersici TaxID=416944 RepID=A0A1G7A0P6_9BURK|nr:LysR family transcriptional regulator [Paraburkholderia lycopersici]SDE08350.1 DNA-binding transcriptional regulator, LysR family [Paraburkholderia lycopersici]